MGGKFKKIWGRRGCVLGDSSPVVERGRSRSRNRGSLSSQSDDDQGGKTGKGKARLNSGGGGRSRREVVGGVGVERSTAMAKGFGAISEQGRGARRVAVRGSEELDLVS
ncbi:uncharacterized protein A4U43_C07F27090 [Asparagus officinalis]|uniref:Uncharacterized protein n=1 Tax=Asparagus officinalis TaxID=4686 RepID=A0A5P1EFI5_ASPOF|nr:uncharacterized protein A4U43_C07F27090 [Asparagus officinalis]